jgi:phosphotransferase system enzyme I (PtsI)
VGSALLLESPSTSIFRVPIAVDRVGREITRLKRALARCKRQLLNARDKALREAGEGYARVFDAQIMILEDSSFVRETTETIRSDCVNAEWAVRGIVERYLKVLSGLADGTARERALGRAQARSVGNQGRRHHRVARAVPVGPDAAPSRSCRRIGD